METSVSQLQYQVFITDKSGEKFHSEVLLATFYLALDAHRYAIAVVNDYIGLGYKFVVTVKRNGTVINRISN